MKKGLFFHILILTFFFASPVKMLYADSEVNLSGTIKLFTSAFTAKDDDAATGAPHKAGDFSTTRGELRLKIDGYASDNIDFKSQVYFIYNADPEYEEIAELESGKGFDSEMHDVDIYFKEAYFKIVDFLTEGLDLTVGRQRVRWGTSDEYNVIDNMNPVDFANLFLFDPDYFVEHLPMDGLSAEYQFPFDFDLKMQAVYFLYFKPSPLPAGFGANMLAAQLASLQSQAAMFDTFNTQLQDVPRYSLDRGVCGLRISGNVLNFDVGLSYYHGYLSLPLLKSIENSPADYPTLNTFFTYPRLDVIGFDLAGELFSIGLWAEAGIHFPEKHDSQFTLFFPVLDDRIVNLRLLEKSYTKFTVGFDYTFGLGNGLYWNTQYCHGFYDELNYTSAAETLMGFDNSPFMGKLEDYFISILEYSFFNDELKFTMSCMLEVADYSDFADRSALLFTPEVEFTPFDGLSLRLGCAIINGSNSSKFGAFSKSDMCFLLLKSMF